MKELFRKNMFLADSDSINYNYHNDHYLKKFKSAVLMAKSIGVSPNMMIDSQGFEALTKDETIIKFFENKFDKRKNTEQLNINIHIFNNYVEDNYFHMKDNKNDNPFLRYYHEKMGDNFLFSSFGGKTKKEIEKNSKLKQSMKEKLQYLDNFIRYYYEKYEYNLFNIVNKNEEENHFKTLVVKNAKHIFKEINNDEDLKNDDNKKLYYSTLQTYIELIQVQSKDIILDRSDCYELFNHHEITTVMQKYTEKIKIDLIDTTYNSRFIGPEDIYRFKSLNSVDTMYSKYFDSYAENGYLSQAGNLYQKFDDIKSKFEFINLILDPATLLEYVRDKLMSKGEEKGMGLLHKTADFMIPKTGLLGVSESKNLLIGTSNEIQY